MIRVETLTLTDVRLKQTREYFDAGTGPYLVEYEASTPTPPGPTGNGLVWDTGNYFVWGAGSYLVWGT